MTRTASTRRSFRKGSMSAPSAANNHNQTSSSSSTAPPRSGSTHSHLAVKNGTVPETTSNGEKAETIKSAENQNGSDVTNAEVVVTETETLLPKKDNKPALIVTKESSSRRPSVATSTRRKNSDKS